MNGAGEKGKVKVKGRQKQQGKAEGAGEGTIRCWEGKRSKEGKQ